jgi:hypothetical protein
MTLLIILLAAGALSWWLSGYNPAVCEEDKAAEVRRRVWRTGATLFLVWVAAEGMTYGGARGGWVLVALSLPLALLWTGRLSELFAGLFHQLIDSTDHRKYQPHGSARELDRLAAFVRAGQHPQAIELSANLLKSGHVSVLAMDAMLSRCYEQAFAEERLLGSPPLAEAALLCREGRALEAESRLKGLLRDDPHNLATLLMLLWVCARGFPQSDKAATCLRTVEARRDLPPGFVAYARRRWREWSGRAPPNEKSTDGIESLVFSCPNAPKLKPSPPDSTDAGGSQSPKGA